MVDRVIEKKRWPLKRILTILGIVALVALAFGSYYFTSGKSRLNVDEERITVSTVTKGTFQETIPVNGSVMPIKSIYLDALEGGRVEERFVEDGAIMKKGQPIMRLSNTEVELSLIQQQTALYNLAAQNQIATNSALQNTVNKRNTLTDAESALREAKRIYELDSVLYSQKAIGSQEFNKAANDYKTALQKEQLNAQIMAQDSLAGIQQSRSNETSYKGSAKALDVMNHKVGDLIVRSPMDGQLTSLDAEIGQSKKQGDRLGQIDTLSGYKVRVDVDEHYLSRIYTDLKGTFSFAGADYKLKIIKVFSQITAGHFQVDMTFVGDVPKGIRRGQTLQILLALSDERQAVLVPRGGFYQQTGGNWIFKVSADGKTAFRADIQLGNQNPEFYEVLSGLVPGDKVVTSSYENYGTMQELVIKK